MRIYQLVRGLAERHDVTCLTFAADEAAAVALAPLRDCCRVVTVIGPPRRSLARRARTTLMSRLPDMALRNASPEYERALDALLGAERFEVVQAESIEMAPYLLAIGARLAGARQRPLCVLDQFNVEYLLQKRAALTSLRDAARGPLRARMRSLAGGAYSLAQWAKLRRFERQALSTADLVLAVSKGDAQVFRALGAQARIGVVPNGVDTATFSRPAMGGTGATSFDGPALVFSGTLDFRPNVDAVIWFAREVLPLIQARCPTARFVVVGRRPGPALRALADAGRLTLTGEVADARPFIAGAAVYVVPMRIGGGVRLNLLEALALEAALVTTSLGGEGVEGLTDGEHCLLADSVEDFAAATLRLIGDRALGRALGAAGRTLVCRSYDWRAIVARLEALYDPVAARTGMVE
jgi:glycosyltransferase involved in cell wall biosynthesis